MSLDIQLLEALRKHGVPFVTVGGHCVNAHGFRRATEDTDVVWLRSPDAERVLLAALTEIGAQFIGKEIDPATGMERIYPVTLAFIQSHHLMMLWTKHGFLDVFDYVPGLLDEPVAQLFASSMETDGVRYASLDHLKKMKRASGRPKDLVDLEELEKLHPKSD